MSWFRVWVLCRDVRYLTQRFAEVLGLCDDACWVKSKSHLSKGPEPQEACCVVASARAGPDYAVLTQHLTLSRRKTKHSSQSAVRVLMFRRLLLHMVLSNVRSQPT